MKRRNVLGVAAVALTLVGGCSLMARGTPTINTTVQVASLGDGCDITPPADISVVKQRPVLQWQISDPNKFRFDSDGIVFDKSPSPPPDEFGPGNPGNQGALFTIMDNNRTRGTYRYSINVVVKANGRTCRVDPAVLNDGCEGCPP